MRPLPRILLLSLLVFAVPFLLGADKCEGHGDYLKKVLLHIGLQLEDLDERVTALEECACDGVVAEVCGSDGRTYLNPCEARCAGVRVVSRGECDSPVCGGGTGLMCDDMSFCETPAGCDPFEVGRCEEIPDACTDEWEPVCGCDGNTYGNDCERRAAGVPLDHEGECKEPPVVCAGNDMCMDDEFCRTPPGSCDARGECQERPLRCTDEYSPVCGCNGMSYSNPCEAHAAGTGIASRGKCEPDRCGGIAGLMCSDDEACLYRPGTCDVADAAGVCVPLPDACPDVRMPVCGCDGVTYGNACKALAAGAAIDHRGMCKDDGVDICHFPSGDWEKRHTITVEEEDVPAHLRNHGDHEGACEYDDNGDDGTDDSEG